MLGELPNRFPGQCFKEDLPEPSSNCSYKGKDLYKCAV